MTVATVREWLTVKTICEATGAVPVTVHRWITNGTEGYDAVGNVVKVHLAATKIAGSWRIKPCDFAAFLEAKEYPTQRTPTPTPAEARRAADDAASAATAAINGH